LLLLLLLLLGQRGDTHRRERGIQAGKHGVGNVERLRMRKRRVDVHREIRTALRHHLVNDRVHPCIDLAHDIGLNRLDVLLRAGKLLLRLLLALLKSLCPLPKAASGSRPFNA
jgi:hypothetical protein